MRSGRYERADCIFVHNHPRIPRGSLNFSRLLRSQRGEEAAEIQATPGAASREEGISMGDSLQQS